MELRGHFWPSRRALLKYTIAREDQSTPEPCFVYGITQRQISIGTGRSSEDCTSYPPYPPVVFDIIVLAAQMNYYCVEAYNYSGFLQQILFKKR